VCVCVCARAYVRTYTHARARAHTFFFKVMTLKSSIFGAEKGSTVTIHEDDYDEDNDSTYYSLFTFPNIHRMCKINIFKTMPHVTFWLQKSTFTRL